MAANKTETPTRRAPKKSAPDAAKPPAQVIELPKDHNSKVLPDIGVTSGVFLADLAEHSRLLDAEKVAKDNRKKFRKLMKSRGIRLKEFDAAVMFMDMQQKDVADHFAHLQSYMVWARHPIGSQLSFSFAGVADDGMSEDENLSPEEIKVRAVQDGFWKGIQGNKDAQNPYTANTEPGQAWIGAYQDGLAKHNEERAADPLNDPED